MVTNTVPLQGKELDCEKITVVDISPTLAGELLCVKVILFFKALTISHRGMQTNA